MNYGRRGVLNRAHQINAKGRRVVNKIRMTAVLLCLSVVVLFALVGLCAGLGVWKGIIDTAPDIDISDAAPSGYYSTILAADGSTVTATLVASGSNRKYVSIDEVPQNLQDAFVAIEDERFYRHNGIDLLSIFRAAVSGADNVIRGGSFDQGGSTITQQLIKNNVLTGWTSETSFIEKLQRKIQEQYLAVELEKKSDKTWILESYMNTINLGANTLGIQAASQRYFGKDVSELTLSECAVIAGITKNPSGYNPIDFPQYNEVRREAVLNAMLNQGYITQAEYDEAAADTNVYARIAYHTSSDNTAYVKYDSYFVDALIDNVYKDLMKAGYSQKDAADMIYQGGLTIYSTQDLDMQKICDEEVNNIDNYPKCPTYYSFSLYFQIQKPDGTIEGYTNNSMQNYLRRWSGDEEKSLNYGTDDDCYEAIKEYEWAMIRETGGTLVEGSESIHITMEPQVALTIIDQSTGEIKAMVGGRGEKAGNRTWNRAVDTLNQPGSTFKILACYAPALDLGIKTLASVQMDEEYTIDGWKVNNNDRSHRGILTVRYGIVNSINVVAVKNMVDTGLENAMKYLRRFGFSTIDEKDESYPVALGGITQGVNNVELTGAFAAIANQGTYLEPKYYSKVVDNQGNVILSREDLQETRQVVSQQTAYLLTSAMEECVQTGTGTYALFDGEMGQAGKTGTTDLNRDALYAGYTPYYTCVIWGGNDDNTEQPSIKYARYLFKAIMGRVHEGLEVRTFEEPQGIVHLTVCPQSGLLAQEGRCPDAYDEVFDENNVPDEYCNIH